MIKSALLIICLSVLGAGSSRAQSVVNTSWKLFIGGEVNDTLTLHIKADSSYVTNSTGEVMVRSTCKVSADTLFINDYDGNYACPGIGTYKYAVVDDKLTLDLVNDQCSGRAENINGVKWIRVKEKQVSKY